MKTWKHRFRQGLVLVLAGAMICGCLNGAALPALAGEDVVTTAVAPENQTPEFSGEEYDGQEQVLTVQAANSVLPLKEETETQTTEEETETQTTEPEAQPEGKPDVQTSEAGIQSGDIPDENLPVNQTPVEWTAGGQMSGSQTSTDESTDGKQPGSQTTPEEKPVEGTTETKAPETKAPEEETTAPETKAPEKETTAPENQMQPTEAPETEKQSIKTPGAPTESTEETTTEPTEADSDDETEETTAPVELPEGARWEDTVAVPADVLPDNDELLAAYVGQLLYPDAGIELFGDFGAGKLSGEQLKIYNKLKAQIQAVAKGTVSSTTFALDKVTWTLNDLGLGPDYTSDSLSEALNQKVSETFTWNQIVSYLLIDCPYDLYWFDKTQSMRPAYQTNWTGSGATLQVELTVTIKFPVAQGYQSGNAYEVDNSTIGVVNKAVAKANEIVQQNQGKSDYEKLLAYKDAICGLVDYNWDALNNNPPYGDPWQLIWVFDGDDATKVVCEGYSKAFQYLCDLSTFQNAVCYTVMGAMDGGAHMWNIVTLDGDNYLVDVTNSDAGTAGMNGELFLAGGTGDVASGYWVKGVVGSIGYVYSSDQKNLYGESILTLAKENYNAKTSVSIQTSAVTVTYGDAVKTDVLTGFSATAAGGTNVPGTFSWAKDVTSYGNAGTKTLKVVFTPTDSKYRTTEAEVTVTVNRKAVTVHAAAAGKTYGEKDPAFTYTVDAQTPLVTGDKLVGTLSRAAGEDVKPGGYAIQQGSLTNANNPNYTITFNEAVFTISAAQYTAHATASQNVLTGDGTFKEPTFTGVNDETVAGTITYTYNGTSGQTYAQIKATLAGLSAGTTATVTYSFTATDSNYVTTPKTGSFTLHVKDIIFLVGEDEATEANAVTKKTDPVYGDTWADIIQIKALKAMAGTETDDTAAHFTIQETGRPAIGTQTYTVVYNGTLNGRTYTDAVVCSGTVAIGKRPLTVTAGTYQVSKTYDGTTTAGTATGSLRVTGILDEDKNDVTVTTAPVAYASPNVGAQSFMELPLTLGGAGAGNYELAQMNVKVPCSILPKSITPDISMTDEYTYTGSEIIPDDITVKNGTDLLSADQYTVEARNNINAGTAEVTISPKAGGNYTWTPVRRTFTILKADHADESVNGDARYGGTRNYDLADLLPSGYQLGTVRVTDADGIFSAVPVLNGTTLSYSLTGQTEKIGKQAQITVPVTESTNYNAYNIVVTVTMLDKLPQQDFQFASASVSKTYGDAAFSMAASGAAAGSTVTYTSSDPAVATVDENGMVKVLTCGTTTITAKASETDDYVAAAIECVLTVAPKVLSWDVSELYAVDREGSIVEKAASLYGVLRVTGMLEEDVQDVTFTCPAEKLAGFYGAVTPGQQTVTLSWADTEHPVELAGKKSGQYCLPDTLPVLKGTINAVTSSTNLPESTESVQLKVEMENGISTVPDAFRNQEHLNTPAKIVEQMYLNIQKRDKGIPNNRIQIFDVVLMIRMAGEDWRPATKNNFPYSGITLVLPYPAGTGEKTHDFVVSHLFTTDMNGHRAGDVEYPEVTKTAEGIRFKVWGLSPIAVGWTEIKADTEEPTQKPSEKPDNQGGSGGSDNNGGNTTTTAAAQQTTTATPAASATSLQAVRSANTGDQTPVAGMVTLMLLSAMVLAGVYVRQRRKKEH